MIKIVVGNSYSQIGGLNRDQEKDVRTLLSYQDNPSKQFFSRSYDRRYLISKRGVFATGLLPLVETYFKVMNLAVSWVDTRVEPKTDPSLFSARLNGIIPYPCQIEARDKAKDFKRGTIVMPTGCGKSITMALLINALKVKTLVVVPTVELKGQLTMTFNSIFGKTPNIVVENIDNPKLKKMTGFDCLIIDEAHHTASKTYRDLNKKAWPGIFHRFFFTATPFRSKDEEQLLLESITGEVIYDLPYLHAVSNGHIVPMEAYYLDMPSRPRVECESWSTFYSENVVKNTYRNTEIQKLMIALNKIKAPTLCLVKEIAHGVALSSSGAFPFMNGQDEESRAHLDAFNKEKIKILIGTSGVLGEGVDTKPCEYVIIAGMGKSRNQFMQQCGRAFRTFANKKTCKIILIRDNNSKWGKGHYATQCKILLDEYGIKPKPLGDL